MRRTETAGAVGALGKLGALAALVTLDAVKVYPTLELVLCEGGEAIPRGPDESGAKLMKLDQPPPK